MKALLAVVLLLSSPAYATLLTFAGVVNGELKSFSVNGPSSAWSEHYTAGFYSTESPISAISEWSVFPEREIPSSYVVDTSLSQTIFGGSRVYHELISGYDSGALSLWSHEIDIRGSLQGGIDAWIGVTDHFTYEEHSGTLENFTFDGSTVPVRNILNAAGTLTLVAVEYNVPEPSTLLLLITSMFLLGLSRQKYLSLL